jgi:thioredoxin 1
MPLERVGAEAFRGEEFTRPGRWAVAFLADWCPFCRAFAPRFESLAPPGPAKLAVADLTSEESPLWETFSIDVVPTVVVFQDGKTLFRRDGRLGRGLGASDLKAIAAAMD